MPRRRCSRKKGKYMCSKCDRFYSSSQSLYYHCYQKHRGINNNNNNIEIDGDNIHNNILIEEEYNDDNLEEISDDDLEEIGALPINVKLQEIYKFEDYKVQVKEKSTHEVKEISDNEVKEISDNEVKEKPVNEVKENFNNQVKEISNNEVKEKPDNKVKENTTIKLEDQNSILKDTLDLINKCLSNNIDINLKIKINNKTIEIKSD
jgi:hypothetical protein